ncbi:putative Secreted protein [metagenome]|uniref:Putative Secreted protein n=1 Tax=metagenome TaxID=256318 RepID=A0A2P2C4H9_9ZZZZ
MNATTAFLRSRGSLLIAGGLVLAVLVSAWVSAGNRSQGGDLDPQSSAPSGARALAQVLGDQGVELDIVRHTDELADADLDDATLLVTSTENLAASAARDLVGATQALDVIVVDPGSDLASSWGGDPTVTSSRPESPVPAQCADTRLTGLELEVDAAHAYQPVDGGCFGAEGGQVFAPQDEQVSFFGGGGAFSNGQITRSDNAALALRLLGGNPRLVWYVPSLEDFQAGDEVGLGTLLPDWLTPALWLAGLTVIALALWRGRRLGPLVSEPLPVVVRAVETTQSRARLYRKARDRQHTTWTLRAAAQRRAASRLGLDRRSDETEVLGEVARHTGLPHLEISAMLSHHGPVPSSDSELNTLADRLASLDEQLRKAPR